MGDNSQINNKILEKLKKFSKNDTEFKFCVSLLERELFWYGVKEPPFKRDFTYMLDKFFPYEVN